MYYDFMNSLSKPIKYTHSVVTVFGFVIRYHRNV
jgi:hypothetical protein